MHPLGPVNSPHLRGIATAVALLTIGAYGNGWISTGGAIFLGVIAGLLVLLSG